MNLERSAGVLLHITSLPGRLGCGSLGPEAYEFADTLARAGQRYWQILPVGPVEGAMGYSPYASPSAFAGNWLFISPEKLAGNKWFGGDPAGREFREGHFVRFDEVAEHRRNVLERAFVDFNIGSEPGERAAFTRFRAENAPWLDDWALYQSLAERFQTGDWLLWDEDISRRAPGALERWRAELSESVAYHAFVQYIFFAQWSELKLYCNTKGIRIIGDIPIYISLAGADAWAHPDILQLDEKTSMPTAVAGVPPDYFSETGQRWGNPLYRWFRGKKPEEATWRWWAERMAHMNRMLDIIRVDHFRGFEAYYAIPGEEKTAVKGAWMRGPGMEFFKMLNRELGSLPLIAEDLGIITPEVERLRDTLGLPGMRILQFAFDFNSKNTYLTHNINNRNCILYTGTHDNNTTNGWFYGGEIDEGTREYVLEYIGAESFSDVHWKLIREAYRSVADLVIVPAQDLLGYGEEFRMNRPGTPEGNWGWKLTRNSLDDGIVSRLRRMAEIYGRLTEPGERAQ